MDRRTTTGQGAEFSSGSSPRDRDSGAEGLGSLIGGIVEDLQGIVRGEVRLAKTELREDISIMGKGATMIAIGAMLALVGFIFLMLGVTYLLNQELKMWQAAGIVGLALLIIGGIAAMVGKNRLSATNLTPTETIDSLKENQQWANQQIKSVTK